MHECTFTAFYYYFCSELMASDSSLQPVSGGEQEFWDVLRKINRTNTNGQVKENCQALYASYLGDASCDWKFSQHCREWDAWCFRTGDCFSSPAYSGENSFILDLSFYFKKKQHCNTDAFVNLGLQLFSTFVQRSFCERLANLNAFTKDTFLGFWKPFTLPLLFLNCNVKEMHIQSIAHYFILIYGKKLFHFFPFPSCLIVR